MQKFHARRHLIAQRVRWRPAGKTVVFTNACYALLHPGPARSLDGTPAALLPDIRINGAGRAQRMAGRDAVKAAGGKVLAERLEQSYSTTGILEQRLARH